MRLENPDNSSGLLRVAVTPPWLVPVCFPPDQRTIGMLSPNGGLGVPA